jgi:hypothetical protein
MPERACALVQISSAKGGKNTIRQKALRLFLPKHERDGPCWPIIGGRPLRRRREHDVDSRPATAARNCRGSSLQQIIVATNGPALCRAIAEGRPLRGRRGMVLIHGRQRLRGPNREKSEVRSQKSELRTQNSGEPGTPNPKSQTPDREPHPCTGLDRS